MAKTSPQLEWCIVRLGEDMNWWVDEISDEIHWDVDGLSILDPRQLSHLIELLEPLHDYVFDPDLFESAFYAFKIEKDLGGGRVRLSRSSESLLDSEEVLFALPDILDEETGPYADFLDHISKLRVKMLNDVMNFEKKLTVDELEEQIRDEQNNNFLEGKSVHLFNEILSIVDFAPAGWEIDRDDDDDDGSEEVETDEDADVDVDDLPDVEEEDDESLKQDASLRWDEDDDEDEEEDDDEGKEESESDEDGEDWSEDEEDDEDEKPRRKRR